MNESEAARANLGSRLRRPASQAERAALGVEPPERRSAKSPRPTEIFYPPRPAIFRIARQHSVDGFIAIANAFERYSLLSCQKQTGQAPTVMRIFTGSSSLPTGNAHNPSRLKAPACNQSTVLPPLHWPGIEPNSDLRSESDPSREEELSLIRSQFFTPRPDPEEEPLSTPKT